MYEFQLLFCAVAIVALDPHQPHIAHVSGRGASCLYDCHASTSTLPSIGRRRVKQQLVTGTSPIYLTQDWSHCNGCNGATQPGRW
jgi:hypothetical protein